VQRIAALVGIVFAISFLCFSLVHILPGNPVNILAGPGATPQAIAILDHQFGFDRPFFEQYFIWLNNVLHGNLGQSVTAGSVRTYIFGAFKVDVGLIVISQAIAFLVAVPLAIYSARRPGRLLDQVASTGTFALFCLPSFVVVIWAVQGLTVANHVFPAVDTSPFTTGSFLTQVDQYLYALILPSLVLALGSIALYYRLLRSEMALTLQEDFITVARSKGLSDRRILWRHALRPSSVTMLTSSGNNIALLITGLFIVEVKFALPGIGYELISAINVSDYLTIQGIALITSITVVVVNFGIDLLLTFVDPRIARA